MDLATALCIYEDYQKVHKDAKLAEMIKLAGLYSSAKEFGKVDGYIQEAQRRSKEPGYAAAVRIMQGCIDGVHSRDISELIDRAIESSNTPAISWANLEKARELSRETRVPINPAKLEQLAKQYLTEIKEYIRIARDFANGNLPFHRDVGYGNKFDAKGHRVEHYECSLEETIKMHLSTAQELAGYLVELGYE